MALLWILGALLWVLFFYLAWWMHRQAEEDGADAGRAIEALNRTRADGRFDAMLRDNELQCANMVWRAWRDWSNERRPT